MKPPTVVERAFGTRFRSERRLKFGQSVETLLGTEVLTGNAVVIKSTASGNISSAAAMRLEHEAQVLQSFHSPLLAPLLAFGRDAGALYLVMPFIPGVTLAERLRGGPLSVTETLVLGRALMGALAEAHDRGVLHRDVKPANVIVDSGESVGSAVLIDFGLARSARLDATVRDEVVGTARYISPEQAGLLDVDVDARSDLYSAGVVLYECVAGHPPFDGESVGEVLRKHVSVPPVELRTMDLAVPRALGECIHRLLRKDPRDRYQSARAALFDLDAIASGLARGEADPAVTVGAQDWRRSLTEPAFVGRASELGALGAELERARRGAGGAALLEARSGGGKTRLLGEFALQALRAGASVFRGQGVDHAAQRPFQLLVGVATDFLAQATREPRVADRVRRQLGDSADAVAAAFPELSPLLTEAGAEALGPETFGEARTIRALVNLLDGLGTAERPAVVVLDDGQWADAGTLKLLEEWTRRRKPGADRHVLVIVAFRSEEVSAGHPLRSLDAALDLDLPSLTAGDLRQLATSMAGPLPESIHEIVERLSEGSPFMASATLRGLVESGALVAEPAGWRVEPLALAEVQSSQHAAALLARRIELLPKEVLAILEVGAMLGKEFDLDLAAALAEQSSPSAIAAIDEARRRHILWTRDLGARCAFVHDRLREPLLLRVPAERLRELHRAAALRIEADAPDRVFDLAYHFDAALDRERALPFALVAAERARARHALGVAEEQYRIAERGAVTSRASVRHQIQEGLGDVLMLRGRYDDAARAFESALDLCEGSLSRAEIGGKLGELWFKRGDMRAGRTALEGALASLGRRAPTKMAIFAMLVAWEAAVQVLHTLVPSLLARSGRGEARATDRLAVHLYNRLTYAYWFTRGPIPTLWAHLRGMNLAERYPPTPELAHAYSIHAPVMALLPLTERGIRYAERSFAIRKSLGDLWGQGQSLSFRGIVLYGAGRYRECIATCREGSRLLERTGDMWEVNVAGCHIAWSLYHLGDLAGAIEQGRRTHESGVAIGDRLAARTGLDAWSRASGGRVPAEVVAAELVRPSEDVQAVAHVTLAEAVRLLAAGRPMEAVDLLEEAQARVEGASVENAYVFPVLAWLATALRQAAEATPPWALARRRSLLRRARSRAKRAVRCARVSPNDLGHALRELGWIAAMAGEEERAQQCFDASLAASEKLEQTLARAETRMARGRVGEALGWTGARGDVTAAREELARAGSTLAASRDEPGAPATLSLADRFDTVLDAGRQIASSLTRAAVHGAVRDAAGKLLRGDRCVVFETLDGGPLAPASGEIAPEASLGLARRVADEGRILGFEPGSSADPSESVVLSGVRSALCAPIFVRGHVTGCFYVASSQVGGLFGEEEERLAAFIAAVAGAALENAEGFSELKEAEAEIRRMNVELEERVERRTSELRAAIGELESFSHSVSHDLRAPLRAIDGFSEALLEECGEQLGANGQRYLHKIRNGARHMAALIDDLLNLSRVSRAELHRESVDVSALARSVLARLAQADPDRVVETVVEDGLSAAGDPRLLDIALTNLLGNAWKFTAKQEAARIEVGRGAAEPGGPTVFFVRDNGAGFDPQYVDRLFGVFARLHRASDFEGTGIGLATVQRIVHRHGGSIWASGEVDKGATFSFTLAAGASHRGPVP